ncbi:MAG: FG-GAP repeat protein [Candidatus Nitrosocaldus sp.]
MSLAAGDFNGDGYTDLAVGVPFESVVSVLDAGAVNILYGSSSGLQASSPDDQFWHQDSPNVDGVAESGDGFGYTL